jgi:hypothetical protein
VSVYAIHFKYKNSIILCAFNFIQFPKTHTFSTCKFCIHKPLSFSDQVGIREKVFEGLIVFKCFVL